MVGRKLKNLDYFPSEVFEQRLTVSVEVQINAKTISEAQYDVVSLKDLIEQLENKYGAGRLFSIPTEDMILGMKVAYWSYPYIEFMYFPTVSGNIPNFIKGLEDNEESDSSDFDEDLEDECEDEEANEGNNYLLSKNMEKDGDTTNNNGTGGEDVNDLNDEESKSSSREDLMCMPVNQKDREETMPLDDQRFDATQENLLSNPGLGSCKRKRAAPGTTYKKVRIEYQDETKDSEPKDKLCHSESEESEVKANELDQITPDNQFLNFKKPEGFDKEDKSFLEGSDDYNIQPNSKEISDHSCIVPTGYGMTITHCKNSGKSQQNLHEESFDIAGSLSKAEFLENAELLEAVTNVAGIDSSNSEPTTILVAKDETNLDYSKLEQEIARIVGETVADEVSKSDSDNVHSSIISGEDLQDNDSAQSDVDNIGSEFQKCVYCAEVVPRSEHRKHLKEKHSRKCLQCGLYFCNLEKHMQSAHPAGKPYSCNRCKKSFEKPEDLSSHLKSHKVMCDICGFVFRTKKSLELHISHHHDPSLPYMCLNCNWTFKTFREGKFHESKCSKKSTVTPDLSKPYKCSVPHCHEWFATKEEATEHKKNHVNAECSICGEVFRTRSLLDIHMPIHTQERAFVCDYCGRAYKRKNHMLVHRSSHTEVYQCPICKVSVMGVAAYRRHSILHEGRFTCQFCNKPFVNKSKLIIHERIHTNDKPFRCELCNLAFSRPDYYRIHLRREHSLESDDQTSKKINGSSSPSKKYKKPNILQSEGREFQIFNPNDGDALSSIDCVESGQLVFLQGEDGELIQARVADEAMDETGTCLIVNDKSMPVIVQSDSESSNVMQSDFVLQVSDGTDDNKLEKESIVLVISDDNELKNENVGVSLAVQ